MGKVTKPLVIVVFPPLSDWPEIVKLEKQGHKIISVEELSGFPLGGIADADIVLGPRCWYMDSKHRKYLTAAIKNGRLRRYGGIAKKVDASVGKPDSSDDADSGSTGC